MIKNLPQKIVSLVFAFVLWIFVMDVEDPIINKTFKNIPIHYKHLPIIYEKNFEIVDNTTQYIDLTLSGKRSEILNTSLKDFYAYVDLEDCIYGENHLDIKLKYPNKYKILSQSKQEITLDIDIIEIIKVTPIVKVLNIEDGFTDVNIINDRYKNIHLKAPRRYLNNIKNIIYEVNVKGLDISQMVSPKVIIDSINEKEVEKITIVENNIEVYVDLKKTKEFPITYILNGELAKDYEIKNISIVPSALKLESEPKFLKNLPEIKPFIINQDQLKESYSEIYKLNLPESIKVLEIPIMKVDVIKNIKKTITFDNNNTKIENLDKSLKIKILNKKTFTFYGDEKILNNFNPILKLNLYNLVKGNYSISATIENVDQSIKIYDDENNKINNNCIKNMNITILD